MWLRLSNFIIKYRLWLVLSTLLITVFMGYVGRKVEMTYDFVKAVPNDDPDLLSYTAFQEMFGEDGNMFAVGIDDEKIFKLQNFNKLNKLSDSLAAIPGVKSVISLPKIQYLVKDTASKKFKQAYIFANFPQNQAQLDSLLFKASKIKMYEGQLYNPERHSTLVAVYVEKAYFNSPRRKALMNDILLKVKNFSQEAKIKTHLAGLPYVRFNLAGKVQKEFKLFLGLSALVSCIVLYLFFRSFRAVLFAGLVIAITVLWTMGTIVLFGFKMNVLTGMLPALIVVISIPNCIYMINQYHQEYKKHRNKVRSVTRIIQKVGFVTFMTNLNTAVGFFVLLVTDVTVVREFGLVAGILSVATFVISIVVIPSLLMYLPSPTERHLKHLDKETVTSINTSLKQIVFKNKKWVYIITIVLIGTSFYGMSRIHPVAFMVDDLPKNSDVKTDLAFFESHFKGVMPLEIVIHFEDKNAILKLANLKLLDQLDSFLKTLPQVSPPVSVLNLVKGSTQALYNGDINQYRLPSTLEKNFILKYLAGNKEQKPILKSLVDSTGKNFRMTMKVADIGTNKMDSLIGLKIKPKIQEIFGEKASNVQITGSTVLFLKGTKYLIDDLGQSLLIAFVLISLMMAFIFTDVKMILISIIPNVLPMLFTVGVMGIFNIPLTTSSALIFSIAFGISIDNTIHYLSKYKQELKLNAGNIRMAVVAALKESSMGMIYTSMVLLVGFGIFMFSDFGGTVALGLLTSMTLFFALFTNLILLPVLLLALESKKDKMSDILK